MSLCLPHPGVKVDLGDFEWYLFEYRCHWLQVRAFNQMLRERGLTW